MKTYTELEIKAAVAMFSAFDIEIQVQEGTPDSPLVINTRVFQWKDGSFRDQAENVQE